MPDDRVKREIEDILSRLDDLPEERKPIPIKRARRARRASSGPPEVYRYFTVRNAMLAAIVLVVIGFFGMRALPYGQWILVGGLVLFGLSFAFSVVGRGSARTAQPQYEKRWRGQPMNLEAGSPSLGDRLRAWFDSKRDQRR